MDTLKLVGKRALINAKLTQRDYTNEGQIERLKFAGQTGVVKHYHDSHGLCYDIVVDNSTHFGMATYDPDEFTIL